MKNKNPVPILSLHAITKRFPGVLANDHISLDIYPAEVHALLGENGAGKSTLMKILYGIYRPDDGEILIKGKPVQIASPQDARAYQIGMVFQDFNLIPAFSVAENIALFLPHLKSILDMDSIGRKILMYCEKYSLEVNPRALVSQLSVGEQQKDEIIKMLLSEAHILILDEPTRVLASHEIEGLFRIFDKLRKDNYSIIFITHKLKEVLKCADRITVLKEGRVVGTLSRANATENKLIKMMFGKVPIESRQGERSVKKEFRQPVLELKNAETHAEGLTVSLKNINLQIFPGEIVGVAGVSGNGQSELGELALGLETCTSGKKILLGDDATHWSVNQNRQRGVAFIPENALMLAVAPNMSLMENMTLSYPWRYSQYGGLSMNWRKVQTDLEKSFKQFNLIAPSIYSPARTLSGGNLQRLVIARELAHKPKLIIASYLTRGLDVRSTIAAHQALLNARAAGAGILYISEDLEELFSLCDRLIVLYSGRVVGSFRPVETNHIEIGHLMTGVKVEHVARN